MKLALALTIGASLVTVLAAQDWRIEPVHRGDARAVLIRGDEVLVVGTDAPPSPERVKAFGLPGAWMDVLRPAPFTRIVVSRDRTQVGRVSLLGGGNDRRSRFEPLDRRFRIDAPGRPAFHVSDNGATIVVAHLDVHNRGEREVAIHDGNGRLLQRLRRPLIDGIHLATDGSVVVLSGEVGVYAFAVREGAVRAIGEMPASPATELSSRGDIVARATENGIALHRMRDGQFGAEPVGTLATGIPTAMRFDPQSTHLAAADGRGVQLFELDGRSERWNVASGDRETVTSLDLSANAALVGVATVTVVQRETRTTPGQQSADVRLLRRDGTLATRQALPGGELSAQAPTLTFFAQDRKLLIETRTDVFTLISGGVK